jgi:heat shock protein HtpX
MVPTAYNLVSSNKIKTSLLMVFFTIFVVTVAFVLTKAFGFDNTEAFSFILVLLIIAILMNFASFYFSDSIILGLSQAQFVDEQTNKELYRLVENLCIADGLPKPKIYIIDDTAPNAFATGRDPNHASIVFTRGILEKLNRAELEGVVAHELSHVKNFDIRLMAVVTILVGLIALMADVFLRSLWFGGRRNNNGNKVGGILFFIAIVLAILSPLIAQLIQLAVSRKREFLADASGVVLTRNPDALAEALLKISSDQEPLEVANKGTAHLYIVNPFKETHKGAITWFANLFNTHPPVEERVAALRAMQ